MNLVSRAVGLSAVVAGAVACGPADPADNSATTSTGEVAVASASDVAALCDAQCDYSERCPVPDVSPDPEVDCRVRCAGKLGTNPVYRKAAITAMTKCYSALPCSTSDDQCTTDGANAVSDAPAAEPVVVACLARHEDCDASGGGSFRDDLCGLGLLFVPTAASAFETCLDNACDQIHACVDELAGRME